MSTTTLEGGSFSVCSAADGRDARLAMQELWLTGTILPVGAHLVVRHGFRSAEDHPLEVVYAFMLPRDAALKRFRVVGAGFDVHSELRPVAEAQEAYEAGLEAGHLATMARTYRDGIVNLTVGNLKPGEDVQVMIELLAGVEARDDGLRFRFPFALAPAYHAQTRAFFDDTATGELELPNAPFDDLVLPVWKQDASSLHRVGFDLDVRLGGAAVEVSSPSHAIRCLTRDGDVRVQLATEGDVPNRDLVLEARRDAAAVLSYAGTDARGRGRFAVLVPSTVFGEPLEAHRRVVFVLDRSGSMSGAPMQQARNAVKACLGALSEQDTFGIVAFDSTSEQFRPSLLNGTMENRDAAARFLDTVHARGGTELAQGLDAAVLLLGDQGGDLFLVTDGQVFGTEDIIARVRRCNARLHCLGIGSASQDRFLALLAQETGGVSRFATPRERVDMETLRLFSSVAQPVARELRCVFEGLQEPVLEPQPRDVVFQDNPLLLFGSCAADGPGALVLTWNHARETRSHRILIDAKADGLGETLRQLQGARLITRAQSAWETPDGTWREALEHVSREYELSSRVMTLVAVAARAGDAAGEMPETRVVPVGMPEGVQFESYFAPSPLLLCSPDYREDVLFQRVDSWFFAVCAEPAPVSAPRGGFVRKSKRDSGGDAQAHMDDMVALAGLLEPDGGMPGDSPAARVAASLALLMALLQEGNTEQCGPFAAHVRRLLDFLRRVDATALDAEQNGLLAAVLRRREVSAGHRRDWQRLVRRIREGGMPSAVVWKKLRQLIRE